jgi:hypothetical protein
VDHVEHKNLVIASLVKKFTDIYEMKMLFNVHIKQRMWVIFCAIRIHSTTSHPVPAALIPVLPPRSIFIFPSGFIICTHPKISLGRSKSRRMRWAGHMAHIGVERILCKVLAGNPEGKRPLGRPKGREFCIRTELREIGWEDVD